MLSQSHHELLIMKHAPLLFFFSESSLFLSVSCTENPAGCMDGDSISRDLYSCLINVMIYKQAQWKRTVVPEIFIPV